MYTHCMGPTDLRIVLQYPCTKNFSAPHPTTTTTTITRVRIRLTLEYSVLRTAY